MSNTNHHKKTLLSIVIPCYNEERTLKQCTKKVLEIVDPSLSLEIIIVDDCSTDKSLSIARDLQNEHPAISVFHHEKNRGKGAALRTGFQNATGDFVAVQDADLEYNPRELKKLIVPLENNEADVVFGSRFLSSDAHRVLYFWHYIGNRFLTFISNMLSDLNLSDMECCYKVFRREVIQSISLKENRFGFEPEIVAKVAEARLRIYEIGVSYYGRTYEEGKKIGAKDGFRALYCIFRYNAHTAPVPIQFVIYVFIGGLAALFNLLSFMGMFSAGLSVIIAAPIAFTMAAVLNYFLCILIMFRHKAKWNTISETLIYWVVVGLVGIVDVSLTQFGMYLGYSPVLAKLWASLLALSFNFAGRRYFVFPEPSKGPWKPQGLSHHTGKS
ncbi:MAG: bifunctional glycosyltransferase family 2/GtrA family protein [Bacteroidetes bacterium]|nr:bifunctional glycosyltransferase family 2/GtrA family protein [Bacteroidota bacterium]